MTQRAKNKIRLYLPSSLAVDAKVLLNEDDAHYLLAVMRLKEGDSLGCFSERDGEFECRIAEISKKHCLVEVVEMLRAPQSVPDIWLCFAPLKKDRTDFVTEKATELGVREILPVITRNTITDKVRTERLQAQVKEASEQCERTDVPIVRQPTTLEKLLAMWPKERILFFADETLDGEDVASAFYKHKGKPAAIIIGPEGGFSEQEKALLNSKSFVCGVALGSRILRAETAACAALSVWQAISGDWKKGE